MKKIKLILLFIILSLLICSCKDNNSVHVHEFINGVCSCGEISKEEQKDTTFVVGLAAEMGNDFFINSIFSGGNNIGTIKNLIYGYTPVTYTKNEKYEVDKTVVKDLTIKELDGIGTEYTIKLAEDLKWNNGNSITAKDYVGSVLLFTNNIYKEVTGQKPIFNNTYGADEYNQDTSGLSELLGVKLIGEYEFSYISLNDSSYQNLTDISIIPYPMDILLPGVLIEQGEKGAKLAGKTTEELKDIITNSIENGYRYMPTVTSGPYKLETLTNTECTLVKNDFYKGNYEGQKSQIDKIILKTTQTTALQCIEAIKKGEFDYFDSSYTENDLKNIDEETVNMINYNTNSSITMGFHCDKGAVRFKEVRQAIAYLIETDNINGNYSLNQWMAKVSVDENNKVIGINPKGQKEVLNSYEYNINKTIELIEKAGYIYGDEACSKLFTKGDLVRYRKGEDGIAEELVIDIAMCIELINSEQQKKFDNFVKIGKEIGFKINVTKSGIMAVYDYYYAFKGDGYNNLPENATYEEILNAYNQEADERIANVYIFQTSYENLLNNASYYTGLEKWGDEGNINFLYVEALDEAAKTLDSATTIEEYLKTWQTYQYQYNENVPTIEMWNVKKTHAVSNKVTGLEDNITDSWDWTYQILYCEINE